jgi:dsDNA-binding SOS-regulon protein
MSSFSGKHLADNSTTTAAAASANYDPLKELQDLFSTEATSVPPVRNKNPNDDLSMFLTDDRSQFMQFTSDTATKNIENLLSSISVSSNRVVKPLSNAADAVKSKLESLYT